MWWMWWALACTTPPEITDSGEPESPGGDCSFDGSQIGEPDCGPVDEIAIELVADGAPADGVVAWSADGCSPHALDCPGGSCSLTGAPPGTYTFAARVGDEEQTAVVVYDDDDIVSCDGCCDEGERYASITFTF